MSGEPLRRPRLLLLVAGSRVYREFELQRLADQFDLLLLSPWEPTWERRYLRGHAEIVPADPDQCVAAALGMARRHGCDGVLTWYEPCVELVSRIAAELGTPHVAQDAVRVCRDKLRLREGLAGRPYSVSRFRGVASREDLEPAVRHVGLPAIVKPRALSASFGVMRVDDTHDLDRVWAALVANDLTEEWPRADGYVVESCAEGQEISVDCAVVDGVVHPLAWALKEVAPGDTFEELGHIVTPEAWFPHDTEWLRDVVQDSHRSLGLDHLVTHTEIMLTGDRATVIEINGRAGGDLIPLLAHRATGIDIAGIAAQVASGLPPHLEPTENCVAGVRFLYADSPMPSLLSMPHGTEGDALGFIDAKWIVEDDAVMDTAPARRYLSRVAYVAAQGASVPECEARLGALAAGCSWTESSA